MKILKELVNIISKFRVDKVEIIGSRKNPKTKFDLLYKEINTGEINSDDEAIEKLYETAANKSTYLKLKNRFKTRLLNTLFFIDTNNKSFTAANRAFYEGNKILILIKILLARGARHSAADLAEKALSVSRKYENPELSYHFSKTLMLYFSSTEKHPGKFEYYKNLTKKNWEAFSAEQQAEFYYNDIGFHFSSSRSSTPLEIANKSFEYYQNLKNLEGANDTQFLKFVKYSLLFFYHDIKNHTSEAISTCQEALGELDNNFNKNKNFITAFARRLFSCQIKLGKYLDAETTAQKYLHVAEKGNINWFKFQISYFMLQLYQENFENAVKVYLEAGKHEQLRFQDEDTRESWKIFGVYVYFFSKSGKIPPNEDLEESLKKFRLSTFLNDVPKFGKDKRGMNVMILIAQVLVLLLNKKYNDIIDRIDALYRYTSRHLSKDDSFRSNCFIKMLLKLPEADFEKSKVERKAAVLLKKLQSVPLEIAPQNKELEVVPYERLWLYILELLEDRPQRLRAVLPSLKR